MKSPPATNVYSRVDPCGQPPHVAVSSRGGLSRGGLSRGGQPPRGALNLAGAVWPTHLIHPKHYRAISSLSTQK